MCICHDYLCALLMPKKNKTIAKLNFFVYLDSTYLLVYSDHIYSPIFKLLTIY